MCGRYSITTPVESLRQLFNFTGLPNLGANYNVAPTNAVPFIRMSDGKREMAFARWGLIPGWAKEVRPQPLINARAETVREKPAFRGAFKHRRCLVPADGFYEWQRPERGPKQPWYIHRADGQPMAMAAIWEDWMGPDGTEIDSLAILTTATNERIKSLHHRMPVIVEPEDFVTWLEPEPFDWKPIVSLMKATDNETLDAWPVTTRVNSVANDDPGLIEPIGPRLSEGPPPEAPEDDDPQDQLSLL